MEDVVTPSAAWAFSSELATYTSLSTARSTARLRRGSCGNASFTGLAEDSEMECALPSAGDSSRTGSAGNGSGNAVSAGSVTGTAAWDADSLATWLSSVLAIYDTPGSLVAAAAMTGISLPAPVILMIPASIIIPPI